MSSARFITFFLAVLVNFAMISRAQEPYYPPPSDINYHNDTLTIYPPDSLPGSPVVLLGYNIYVDSVFYDNFLVENQTDTVDFIPDFSSLYPGNHEFCAYAVYNEWISDPACDSALVIYGYELPFLEDWSSGNFTQNQWITESGNWTVETEEGNPGPAAVFSGLPAQYNYEIPLESYAFRGDLLHVGSNWLAFDLKLTSINNTGNEKIVIQRWNWNSQQWQDWDYYANQSGSFSWSHKEVPLWNNYGSRAVFKIRLVARGNISSDISFWSIDNIHIYRKCLYPDNLIVDEFPGYYALFWSIPSGCGPTWFNWDDGQNSGNSIGTGAAAEFSVAARWEPAQIDFLNGYSVGRIAFFPAEAQADYNVRVWQGDSVVNLIIDQPVIDPQIGTWNDIVIDSLVTIDITKDLYVGYHINAQTGYPAGVDDGPAINGYGNMMYWQDTWQTLLEINPDLDYNWNIAFAVYDPDDPEIRCLVYRNTNDEGYQLYDIVEDVTYEDHNINEDDYYCYKVTMEWSNSGDTCESVPTNEACETLWLTADSPSQELSIKIYPNPAKDLLHIIAEEDIQQIRLYSVLGELMTEIRVNDVEYFMDVSGVKDGVYFLEVKYGKEWIKKKVVVLR